jgi:hypothetical protein
VCDQNPARNEEWVRGLEASVDSMNKMIDHENKEKALAEEDILKTRNEMREF